MLEQVWTLEFVRDAESPQWEKVALDPKEVSASLRIVEERMGMARLTIQ